MDDDLAGLEAEILPSANFQLDSSDEDNDVAGDCHDEFSTKGVNTNGSDLLIFSRTQHMKAAGVTVYEDVDEDPSNQYDHDDSITSDQMAVVDIEEENSQQPDSNNGGSANTGVNNGRAINGTDDDDDWIQFQSTFNEMVKKSEADLVESVAQERVDKMKEEVLIKMMSDIHGAMATHTSSSDHQVVVTPTSGPSTKSVSVSTEDEEDPVLDSVISQVTSKRVTNTRGHLILQSSRFDRVSESDLDTVLEAIEEEGSREGSLSPSGAGDKVGFKWEPMYTKDGSGGCVKREQELMDQLVNAYKKEQAKELGKETVVVTANGSSDHSRNYEKNENQISSASPSFSGTNYGTTCFLDLRDDQNMVAVDDNKSISGNMSHFLEMRLSSGNKSSSEESEDPYSWKEERQLLKNNNKSHSNGRSGTDINGGKHKDTASMKTNGTPQPAQPSSSTTKKKGKSKRKPLSSSGSISEDDLFVSSFNEDSGSSPVLHHSSQSDTNSPPAVVNGNKAAGSKKGKTQKKKKRKGGGSGGSKGKKDSFSGSDGEGGGSDNGKSKTSVNNKGSNVKGSTGAIPIPSNNGGGGVKKKSHNKPPSRRLRHDSWPFSSDEDTTGSPRVPLYSYGSDSESLTLDTDKMKQYLQKRIESRKPPFLFNTPVTPPVFHQDASFSPSLPSVDPAHATPTQLLILPLTDAGLVPIPHTSDVHVPVEALHVIRIALTVWLVSLYDNGSEIGLKPFGLLQSCLDGRSCIIVGLTDPYEGDLSSLSLSSILSPILSLPSIADSIPQSLHDSLSHILSTPLSLFLTLQTDVSPLSTPLSFYWTSLYNAKCLPSDNSFHPVPSLQVTVCTLKTVIPIHTELLFTLLYQAMKKGLDVAGVRFCFSNIDSVFDEGSTAQDLHRGPTLALAFRGTSAIQVLQDIVGPEDPSLAVLTDPNSISAVFKEDSKVLSCVHSHFWAGVEIAKWFGGRACPETGSILGVSDAITRSERRKRQRVRFSESENEETAVLVASVQPSSSLPDVMSFTPLVSNVPALTAYSYSSILFIGSPLVHPLHYSTVLRSISVCGFDVVGIKRLRLNLKRASVLRLPPETSSYFMPSSGPNSPEVNSMPPSFMAANKNTAEQNLTPSNPHPPLPSVIFILGRENAVSHTTHLIHTCFTDLKAALNHDNKLSDVESLLDLPNAFFHALNYSDECLKVLGSFTSTPSSQASIECEGVVREQQVKEEIGVLSVMGSQSLDNCITLMKDIYCTEAAATGYGPVELVGMKLVPELSRFHAKHIPPSGTLMYQDAVDHITGRVTLLLVFRGINVNSRLCNIVNASKKQKSSGLRHSSEDFECFCSVDASDGFKMASMFFIDKELFIDPDSWALRDYVPPSWTHDSDMLHSLTLAPEPLVSVFTVSLKHIRLIVKILDKLVRTGFTFVGLRIIHQCVSPRPISNSDGDLGRSSIDSDSIGSVLAVCVQRYNAVWQLHHDLASFQDTLSQQKSSNILKVSCSYVDAVHDVKLYFPHGLHTSDESIQKYYQVQTAPVDSFKLYHPMNTTESPLPDPSHTGTSPLSEEVCLFICSSLLMASDPPTCLSSIIDTLNKAGYSVRELLMTELSDDSLIEIHRVMDHLDENQVSLLAGSGACVIVMAHRDNGASCFNTIISNTIDQVSGIREDSSVIKTMFRNIIHTNSCKQSKSIAKLIFHAK